MRNNRVYEIYVKHEDGEIASYYEEARTAKEAKHMHDSGNYGTKVVSVKWVR